MAKKQAYKHTIDPKGLPSYKVALIVQAFYQDVEEIFAECQESFGNRLTDEITSRHKIASAYLISNSRYVMKVEGNTYSLNLVGPNYIEKVEYGRRPGTKVPLEELKKWMKLKKIQFRERTKKEHMPTSVRKRMQFMEKLPTDDQEYGWTPMSDDIAARRIQENIYKYGTRSSKYVFGGIRKGTEMVGKYYSEPDFLFQSVHRRNEEEFLQKITKIDILSASRIAIPRGKTGVKKYIPVTPGKEITKLLADLTNAMYIAFQSMATKHIPKGAAKLETPLKRQAHLIRETGEEEPDIFDKQDMKVDLEAKQLPGDLVSETLGDTYLITKGSHSKYKKVAIREIAQVLSDFGRFGQKEKMIQNKDFRKYVGRMVTQSRKWIELEVTKGGFQKVMVDSTLNKAVKTRVKGFLWHPQMTHEQWLNFLLNVSYRSKDLGIRISKAKLKNMVDTKVWEHVYKQILKAGGV